MDIDDDELMKRARRVSNIIKVYHVLSGLTKKDDTLPQKFFSDPPPAPKVVMTEERLERMTREYYQVRGWDDNGIPKQATLRDLDLEYLHKEMERRGVSNRSR
jgi:aldehyde:ferredoxin oxidoreductase